MSGENQKENSNENRNLLPGLAVTAVLGGLLYWLFFVGRANLYALYHVVHLDGVYVKVGDWPALLRFILAFAALGFLYLIGWWITNHVKGRLAWAIVLIGALAYAGIMLSMAPYDADDIYDNISHGRTLGIYRSNPFVKVPNNYPQDPFTPYVAWSLSPSAYGPLWEIMAGATAVLAGNGIVQNVWAFKLLPGIFWLATIPLIILILRQKAPGRALTGTLIFAWNPMVLFETWGNGHNDMAMVFWIVLAVWAIINRHYTLTILSLLAGALMKYIPLLLIPVAGLIILRELKTWRSRLSFALVTGLLALTMVLVVFIPFWNGNQTLTISRREHMFTASIPSAAYQILLHNHVKENQAASTVSTSALVVLGAFILWQSVRAMQNPNWDSFAQASMLILAFYLMITVLWYQGWYVIWVLSLAPLVMNTYIRRLGVIFSFASLDKILIVGPYLYWAVHRKPEPWFEIWFAIGVMIVPWLYSLYAIWRSHVQPERVKEILVKTVET